jgi:CBS domain-containing protein
MVTDRDITIRGVAAGLAHDVGRVSDVMTQDLQFCTEDQDTEEVMRTMGQAQVRRLPVVNMDSELVGIVSIADMARRQPGPVKETVREITEPSV